MECSNSTETPPGVALTSTSAGAGRRIGRETGGGT